MAISALRLNSNGFNIRVVIPLVLDSIAITSPRKTTDIYLADLAAGVDPLQRQQHEQHEGQDLQRLDASLRTAQSVLDGASKPSTPRKKN